VLSVRVANFHRAIVTLIRPLDPSSNGVGGPLRSPPTLHRCKLRRNLSFG